MITRKIKHILYLLLLVALNFGHCSPMFDDGKEEEKKLEEEICKKLEFIHIEKEKLEEGKEESLNKKVFRLIETIVKDKKLSLYVLKILFNRSHLLSKVFENLTKSQGIDDKSYCNCLSNNNKFIDFGEEIVSSNESNNISYEEIEEFYANSPLIVQQTIDAIEDYATAYMKKKLDGKVKNNSLFTYNNIQYVLNSKSEIVSAFLLKPKELMGLLAGYFDTGTYKEILSSCYAYIIDRAELDEETVFELKLEPYIFSIDIFFAKNPPINVLKRLAVYLLKARCLKVKELILASNLLDESSRKNLSQKERLRDKKNRLIKEKLSNETISLDSLLEEVSSFFQTKEQLVIDSFLACASQDIQDIMRGDIESSISLTPLSMYFGQLIKIDFDDSDLFQKDLSVNGLKKLLADYEKLDKIMAYILLDDKENTEEKIKKEKEDKNKFEKLSDLSLFDTHNKKTKPKIAKKKKIKKKKITLCCDKEKQEETKKVERNLSLEDLECKELEIFVSPKEEDHKKEKLVDRCTTHENHIKIFDLSRGPYGGKQLQIILLGDVGKKEKLINHLSHLDYAFVPKMKNIVDNNHAFSQRVEKYGSLGEVTIETLSSEDRKKIFGDWTYVNMHKQAYAVKDFTYKIKVSIPAAFLPLIYVPKKLVSGGDIEFVILKTELEEKNGLCLHRFYKPA